MRQLLILIYIFFTCLYCSAQQYTGLSGMIHVSNAEMDNEGDVRLGVHYLNGHFLPDKGFFSYNGKKYGTFSYYMSLTPFSWIEIGYTCTLVKQMNSPVYDGHGYEEKDQYVSVKLRPLKEGKWNPAIAIGCNDMFDSFSLFNVKENSVEATFGNYYIAATKHINIKKEEIGFHLSYRHFTKKFNSKWNGVVGGVTYRPSFYKPLRGIVEYTGNEVNFGADCLLWKHLLLQASLQDGKYFSGGVCFQMNLF